MFHMLKNKKNYPAYVSKYKLNRKTQLISLMVPNKEGCHYLAVKKLPAPLLGITSKDDGEFYCLNLLYSFATEKKLVESH